MDMEGNFEIKTNDFIALCYIIDEYDSINNDIKEIMLHTDKGSFIKTITQLSDSSLVLLNRKIKEFYSTYKPCIDQLEKHVKFTDFFMDNYDYNGLPKPNIEAAHDYLIANRNRTNIILDVLYAISGLDIANIELHEKLSFDRNPYEIKKDFDKNKFLYYLYNSKTLPTYENDVVRFISEESPYEIRAKVLDGHVSLDDRLIRCNTLIFNPLCLPKRLNTDYLFDELLVKGEEISKYNELVREYVDLSISLDHLMIQYERTSILVGHSKLLKDREEVKNKLREVKGDLEYLMHLPNTYLEKTPLTRKQLEDEKNLHLVRKNNNKK